MEGSAGPGGLDCTLAGCEWFCSWGVGARGFALGSFRILVEIGVFCRNTKNKNKQTFAWGEKNKKTLALNITAHNIQISFDFSK